MVIIMRCIGIVIFTLCSVMSVQAKPLFAYDRAIAAGNNGNLQQAEQLLGSVLIDNPDSASCLYDAGVIAYKKGDVDHAATYFKQATRLSDGRDKTLHEQALFNLGNSYVRQQKLEEALDCYKEVVRLNPDNERAKKNKEVVEELLKKKEEEKKEQEQQQNNQQQKEQPQDQKQNQNSEKNKNKNSDSDKSNDQSQEKQQSDEKNKQDNDQQQNQPSDNNQQGDQTDSGEEGSDQSNDGDDQQSGEQSNEDVQQSDSMNEQKNQTGKTDNNQDDQQQQKEQEGKGAGAQQTAGQKRNQALQALDAALAEIVEKQDKQDAQLNKQLVKILIDNQQPKRSRNGNAPRW